MIRIQLKKKTSITDFTSEVMNDLTNLVYLAPKEVLEQKVKDAKCEIHKSESFGTIYINAEKNGNIEFVEFCCDSFRNKFIN
jgi:hypothetical protein